MDFTFSLTDLEPSYRLSSRIHPLHHFPSGANWFVKRDDELSFSISGSKYRKYASLIFNLKKYGYTKASLVGSARSNHIVGLLQLLHENQITPVVYLLKPHLTPEEGNYEWIKLLMKNNIHYLSKDEWNDRDRLISSHLTKNTFYIPEGGDSVFSLAGAMTIAKDIAFNAIEARITFDHIFIDGGTGLSAIALLVGMTLNGIKSHVHIILMAHDPDIFEKKLLSYKDLLEKHLSISLRLPQYTLYPSSINPSFGSISPKLFEEIRHLAQEEGIITDPIYSAKLFYSAKKIGLEKKLTGNILCIHSGGAFTLSGFQKNLFKVL